MVDQNDFIPVSIDLDTLQNSPELIQVRNAGNFTPDEAAYWQGMSKLTNLNTFLTTDPDIKSARDNFSRLSPELQEALIRLNPEADYAQPDEGLIRKTLFPVASWFSNPLRTLEKVGEKSMGILQNAVLNTVNFQNKISDAALSPFRGSDAIEKVTSRDYWTEGWNGYNKWNQEAITKLDAEYTPATGILARGLIDGKNVFEIFREYGGIDEDMANAFSKLGTDEFQEISDRYKRNKINLGSRIVDWAGKFAPYRENPTTTDFIRDTFASAVLSLSLIHI